VPTKDVDHKLIASGRARSGYYKTTSAPPAPGPIMLQGEENVVVFRNLAISLPLEPAHRHVDKTKYEGLRIDKYENHRRLARHAPTYPNQRGRRDSQHGERCAMTSSKRSATLGIAVMQLGMALGVIGVQEVSGQERRASVTAKVDKIFAEWDRSDAPGCAVAAIRDGRIVYARGYGMANLEYGIPLNDKSVFMVASVTKQFTAMAIVLLSQDGKLSLDDDVRKFIPELPDFGTPITLRHLLHHTSGLREISMLLLLADWRDYDNATSRDMLDLLTRQRELNFKPGEEFSYNNTGYMLLAEIVRRVSGKSLREFAKERIFGPLGMHNTQFLDLHTRLVRNRAAGYLRQDSEWHRIERPVDEAGYGRLVTSVEDLARWEGNFLNPKVGGQSAIAQLMTPGRFNSGRAMDYGYGLGLWLSFYAGGPPPNATDYLSSLDALPDTSGDYTSKRTPNQPLGAVWHGGTGTSSRAGFIRFPDERFAVAIACNTDVADVSRPMMQTVDVFLGDRLKQVVKPSPVSAATPPRTRTALSPARQAELQQFTGVYHTPWRFAVWRLNVRDGRLFVAGADAAQQELVPLADGRFLLATARETATVAFSRPASESRPVMTVEYDQLPGSRRFEPVDELVRISGMLAEYVGSYYSPELDVTYQVVRKDTALVVRRRRRGDAPMIPMFADAFRVYDVGMMRFVRDHAGRVTGFHLTHRAAGVRRLSFIRRTPDAR
jgi:CubicO group peptidase (beta-lactamase class C family)